LPDFSQTNDMASANLAPSPYCGHCQEFAPTFQTLYEYYWTSKPRETGNFTEFYDLRFGMINCVAYQDFCTALGVAAWPTTIFFEDGEEIDKFKGVKDMKTLSDRIEKILEARKPGSRPATIELPEPGAAGTAEYLKAKSNKSDKSGKGEPKDKEKVAETTTTNLAEPTAGTKATGTKGFALEKASVPTHKATSKKPTKPTATPNINGTSVPLTAETFQRLVTMTQDPWFIKFYAPWCHHCQKMAPIWEQLAKDMKGKLNIGEVNCDAESRLCKDARLHGYPTILFFKGGERVEYEGLRGIGDFRDYAKKGVELAGGVQDVDASSFKALEEKEEVIFVYFYDHATTSEDFLALERFPLSLIGRAKLVKTSDPAMFERFKITTWPRLLVSREGRPTYYNPLTPREMRDTHLVLTWMKSVWLPLIPELTASNAREIMDGKLVVLGILNRGDEDSFLSAKREMKSAASEWMDKQIQLFQLERQDLRDAKQLRIEEAEDRGDQRALRAAKNIRINMDRSDRKEVTFAWVDGTFWQRWIRTTYGIDVKDGERVIINDEDVSYGPFRAQCVQMLTPIARTDDIGTRPALATTLSPPGHRFLKPSTKSQHRRPRSSRSSPFLALRRSSSTFALLLPSTHTLAWAASSALHLAVRHGSGADSGGGAVTSGWRTTQRHQFLAPISTVQRSINSPRGQSRCVDVTTMCV